jgi:hypothetical protein
MAPNSQSSVVQEILSALDADPALIEHYDPNEIEAIPLAAIQARLTELELTPAMPADLQRVVMEPTPSPAADVLRALADESEFMQPQSVEAMPLIEVTACLQRRGTNYRAGTAAIVDFVSARVSASAGVDKDQREVRSTKAAGWRSRKSLLLATIATAAIATAAAAATVEFFAAREARQERRIADQQHEIRELSNQIQGLKAKLAKPEDRVDDLISLAMLVPPSDPREQHTWPVPPSAHLEGRTSPPQDDRSTPAVGVGSGAPAMNVVVAPEARLGDGSGSLKAWARALRDGDFDVAQRSLENAARNGDVMATWKLGRMYADASGVKQDDLRAFEYFRGIADSHADEVPGTAEARFVANAFVALGGYYLAGIPSSNIKPDAARAREMFSYAATYFGDPDAQYHLGRMYLDGQGTPKDPKQAARWLSLAAAKGQYQAQALFGAMLFKGELVPRDPARGLMWLMLARDAATPKETWITDLYSYAMKQAIEDERAVALVYLERWLRSRRE